MRDKPNNNAGFLVVALVVLLLFIVGAVGIGGLFLWRMNQSREAALRYAIEARLMEQEARIAAERARAEAERVKKMAEEAKAKDRAATEQDVEGVPDVTIEAEPE